MENGKIKLTHKKHTGLSKTDCSTITKESTSTSTFKNGKIRQVGGVQPSKEIYKSTLKRLTLNLLSYLT